MKLKRLICLWLWASMLLPVVSFAEYLPDEKNTIQIFESRSPYVAYIYRLTKVMNYARNVYEVPSGTGSGFIWNKKGYIITNYHVVVGASDIAVSLVQGKTSKAKIIGVDPANDIAVIRVYDKPALDYIGALKEIKLADSSLLRVGQKAIAIGNPFGLSRTITTGIISALGRRVPGYAKGISHRTMIQTDAAINQGNSGGPLFDSSGRLIGMNTAIYSGTGGSVGIGFAVPSNIIKRSVEQLVSNGRVIQPGIGITRLDDDVARQLGIKGVIIDDVLPRSPAQKAGLRGTIRNAYGQIVLGDIIVGLNEIKIRNFDDLYNALSKVRLGAEVKLEVLRRNGKKSFKIKTFDIGKQH